ncbi:MAG: glycosyltransferase [Eubacteriales bacterium]|nr:glycosyltransferase [Eubacteriales bacterium]
MITVDILSPVGGLHGGVENVIKSWIEHFDKRKFKLRVVHMTPGIAYLKGYIHAYEFKGPKNRQDMGYYVQTYGEFILVHGAPDICVATNWPLMSAVADVVRKRLAVEYKIVSWVHSRIEKYSEAGLGGVAHLMYADAHLAINNHIRDKILEGNSTAKVYVIGNPVKLVDCEDRANEASHVLAYVGRIDEMKRLDIILEAMYRAKSKWLLKIVGSGEFEEEAREIVRYLKLDESVEFTGWQENPWKNLNDAVALVMASEYEGFALSAVEALSAGKMVISTPVDGIIDYIVPGVNGYFYKQEDAIGLAEILDMIASNKLPVCSCKACRASVIKYSEDNYYAGLEKILKNL